MAGTVFLKTNLFDVKLEGITFKTNDFASLCKMDFLFPDRKFWSHPPVVGLDVMPHPRDPSTLLLLFSFGIGCVILRFGVGEALPLAIHKFLADKRVRFVAFGIQEKEGVFPFEQLGLTRNEVDVGYLAADVLNDSKYKTCELSELARKVIGIKKMIGLTEASSFERHEQIKCSICQLFVTTLIAMGLLGADEKKKSDVPSKKNSFLKNLNSLNLLAEGWFKLPLSRNKKRDPKDDETMKMEDIVDDDDDDDSSVGAEFKDSPVVDWFVTHSGDCLSLDISSGEADVKQNEDYTTRDDCCMDKKPMKGILKCPSKSLQRSQSFPVKPRPISSSSSTSNGGASLRRANSKGYNVRFKFH